MIKPGKIITKKKIKDREVVFCYPKLDDIQKLQQYANQLSQEKTFVSLQGQELSLEDEEKYVNDLLEKMEKKKGMAVLAFADGELVGNTDLSLRERTEKHIGVMGISVKKGWRDQGIGSALVEVLLSTARQELPELEIVSLSVYSNNERAIHLYQKFGFKKYGCLPKGVKRDDGYFDHDYMYLQLGNY